MNNDQGALTIAKFYLESSEQLQNDDLTLYALLEDLYEAIGDQRNLERVRQIMNN